MPKNYTPKSPEEKRAEMKAIYYTLIDGVKGILTSDAYVDYLRSISVFRNYSFRNTILILTQCPEASRVAGFCTWRDKFHRHVVKGQHGIKILGGSPHKRKVTRVEDGEEIEEEIFITSYFPVTVFDVSQTAGDPLPEDNICKELEGNLNNYEELKEKIIRFANIPVSFESIDGSAHGYFSPSENRIVIKEGMSELQTIKTLIHETAHSILHKKGGSEEKADRNVCEIQAESIAYSVCNYLGLDTSDYSFGYIAGWANSNTKKVIENMEVIQDTAVKFLNALDANKVAA